MNQLRRGWHWLFPETLFQAITEIIHFKCHCRISGFQISLSSICSYSWFILLYSKCSKSHRQVLNWTYQICFTVVQILTEDVLFNTSFCTVFKYSAPQVCDIDSLLIWTSHHEKMSRMSRTIWDHPFISHEISTYLYWITFPQIRRYKCVFFCYGMNI